MESVLNLVVNAENVRILLIIVFGFSGFVWLKTSLEKKIIGVDKRIDELSASLNGRIDELKYNDLATIKSDFAHLSSAVEALNVRLNSSFEALTYVLEKNGSLSKEDKKFVDTRLAN